MSDATAADDYLETELGAKRWMPPPELTTHAETPIDSQADFFAGPPAEIGDLVSASTTLTTKARPWKSISRIVLAGLVGAAGATILGLFENKNNPADHALFVFMEVGLFIILALIIWFCTGFRHTCAYVGKLGLAKIQCKGDRDRLLAPEVFLFEDAAELRTSQTRHYHNGVYTGTNYLFTWTNEQGNKAFKLSGTYRGEKAPPKPKDPFHFAVMAENAWSAYLFDQIIAELQTRQSARFNLSGRNFVAVGDGFLDILVSGTEPIRLTTDEIGGIQFDSGVVKIKTVDAKEGWFSSTGVYKFSYDQMANSRLFLLLYAKLIGK